MLLSLELVVVHPRLGRRSNTHSAWSFGELGLGRRAVRSEHHLLFHSQLVALEFNFHVLPPFRLSFA